MFDGIVRKWARRGSDELRKEEALLDIKALDKRSEFASPSPGYADAGARDRPTITGNVRRGVVPMAQLGLGSGEAILHAQVARLEADVNLEELLQLRNRLLTN